VIGPSFAAGQIPDVIADLLEVYVGVRHEGALHRRARTGRAGRLQGAGLWRGGMSTLIRHGKVADDRWQWIEGTCPGR
jgi:hypothetical protein